MERARSILAAGWDHGPKTRETAWRRASDESATERTIAEAMTRSWYELTGDEDAGTHGLPGMRALFVTIEEMFDTSRLEYSETDAASLAEAWNVTDGLTRADKDELVERSIERARQGVAGRIVDTAGRGDAGERR